MNIKKLISETFWYGFSTIFARLLNYILTPYITYKIATNAYGEMSTIYALIPFFNVLVTHGMETSFFNFVNLYPEKKESIYNTASWSILVMILLLVFFAYQSPERFKNILLISNNSYWWLMFLIIVTDALTAIPFCKLRQDGRPIYYAVIKISGILCYMFFMYYFLSIAPERIAHNKHFWLQKYNPQRFSVQYILIANLLQNILVIMLLLPHIIKIKFKLEFKLWLNMFQYGWPMIVVGLAGMVNETFDRIMLGWLAVPTKLLSATAQIGIYSACYKLSMLVTFAVQAFKLGAEPFFFKNAQQADAKQNYARILSFFSIVLCILFLIVMLLLPIWRYFIAPKMWSGLSVVPILLLANMFLGVYYNLSIWYKLAQKTKIGIWITLIGCFVTIGINWIFIPKYGYMACAWATCLCYGTMMVVCYKWGQKHYPIPYKIKKMLSYFGLCLFFYFLHSVFFTYYFPEKTMISIIIGVLLILVYILWAWFIEFKYKKSLGQTTT
ncbi:MAG: oligosaccharide flippase family protein [Alphaproteobacteria bacterium]|nr:oligosaccharide flippase family protein [Alphaproteobacteria bacterium]